MTKYTGYFLVQRNNIGKANLDFSKASDLTITKMKKEHLTFKRWLTQNDDERNDRLQNYREYGYKQV